MFLLALGASLTIGAAAFAAAVFSDGALLALRTAAQIIGWLLIAAALAGALALKRRELGGGTAVMVSMGCGMLLLYLSLFDWSEVRGLPAAHAAMEAREPVIAAIENPSPALAAALGVKQIVIPPLPKHEPAKPLLNQAPVLNQGQTTFSPKVASPAVSAAIPVPRERPCVDKTGLARLLCEESARLEYCQSTKGDDSTCPSPIPTAYPG